MRILVVDDSVVFRSQIKSALDAIEGIVVAQTAANGKIALDRLEQNTIDVVILDLEMPELDGISTLKEMRKRGFNQKVIVFASASKSAVDLVFSALEAGASDFISKPANSGSFEEALEGIKSELLPKVLQFQKKDLEKEKLLLSQVQPVSSEVVRKVVPKKINLSSDWNKMSQFKPRAIGIGASTGGPTALSAVFAKLKGHPLHLPIFITQHMPPMFTEHLAKSIESLSGHPTNEGKNGEIVKPGHIYVAPGDFHMSVIHTLDGSIQIRLDQGAKRNSVRPAVDNLFESLSHVYGHSCVAFVFTGMGEDGVVGAKSIKAASGSVIIQDEASCVVWGMPGAIYAANAFDVMGNLDECAQSLIQMACSV